MILYTYLGVSVYANTHSIMYVYDICIYHTSSVCIYMYNHVHVYVYLSLYVLCVCVYIACMDGWMDGWMVAGLHRGRSWSRCWGLAEFPADRGSKVGDTSWVKPTINSNQLGNSWKTWDLSLTSLSSLRSLLSSEIFETVANHRIPVAFASGRSVARW